MRVSLFDLDTWQEIGETVRRNKLRTALTALGVFWGMFMLLLMLGFGGGLEKGVQGTMGDNASNAVYLWGGRASLPYQGMRPGRYTQYTVQDIAALRAEVKGIDVLAPRNQLGGWRDGTEVTHGGKVGSFQVMGDEDSYPRIQPMQIGPGRFINPRDLEERRKIAVLGARVVEELFDPGEDPIGGQVRINGVYFQVVGVFRSTKSGDRGDRENGTIHVPFTTFQRAFNTGDNVGWMAVTGTPEVDGAELERRLRAVLAKRHKLHPDDEPAIGSYNQAEEFGRTQALFAGIRLFVSIVGGLTLLSGVFGVSNIMLISIRERTKEIGLRRALGATPGSIVALVLQEAVVLTAVAGYAGLLSAVALLEGVSKLVGEQHEVLGSPQVQLNVTLVAGLVLVVAGVLAGVIPARHAAKIDPVIALRTE